MNLNRRIPLRDEPAPEWADELDESRRKDSLVGKSIMYLIGTTAVMGLIKFAVEKWHLL